MNTFVGPFRLMMKELGPTFYINALITFVLFIFFTILGFSNADSGTFMLFGPLFIIFLLYPFINFRGYRYILSLGGTRKQFVLAFYLAAFIYSVSGVLLLNLFYYISTHMSEKNSVNFIHLANFVNDSNWFVNLWVDFSWIVFVFGLGMIAKTILFNYGTLVSLTITTVLLIISVIVFVFGDISWLLDLIFNQHLLFVNVMLGVSVLFLSFSYILMRNAPLEKGNRLNIKTKS